MTKIFKIPFATQGDRTSIPDDVQADGAVSYTQGYSYDYERDQQTDPAAKDIEREKMNGMFHDITEAIGELQSFGFPKWAVEGKPYPIRCIVYHKNKTWQSKIENNTTEPVAGAAWVELKADLSAGDINVYTKTESDKRFQPLGNYQPAGYSYSKAESDSNYQPKGNYAPAGNYALKGESYTKAEGDTRYQPKGSYQPSGDYALKGDSYTKAETDGKYQPKGSYQAAGYSYSKAESDTNYQPKGNYAPAGNYALKGDSYTKAEGDTRYQAKGSYQPSGDYALKGDSYTKAETDNKYQPKGSYQATGYSYSKAESDTKYQAKGNYAPAGNYALKGESYTKAEGDTRYQPKGSYQLAGNYALKGDSYTKSESYSRTEVDSKINTGFGNEQKWKDVSANRKSGVTYTNSTGRPIAIAVMQIENSQNPGVTFYVDGLELYSVVRSSGAAVQGGMCIIPRGSTYKFVTTVNARARVMEMTQ
ncbi:MULTISPECIES: hypothetical protein [Providencia]|uniref:hypothetical protein n=1 Tax=Providencia TaxID=586 RepID=UPI001FB9A48A|nr:MULTISPECIES: hypothetical protein [Providencia]MCJ2228276.1 hypothetical protein [Providencia rettgeri]